MKFSKRLAVAATLPALTLAGCYIVPISPDGRPVWPPLDPAPIHSSTPYAPPLTPAAPSAPAPSQPASAVLQARLYPANEIATQTGVLNGTVTNMMSGKGRFNLNYRGEVLSGEATRTSGDARKGVASAYGTGGSFMSCEYQMSSPLQGAGECTLSNGARYQVHISN
jgi:hypothetical protein